MAEKLPDEILFYCLENIYGSLLKYLSKAFNFQQFRFYMYSYFIIYSYLD